MLASLTRRLSTLAVRSPAPAFTAQAVMPSGEFKQVTNADFKGKYVVMFWYPRE